MSESNFIFIDLAGSADARAFDGLAAGTFTDMRGRKVTFEPEELQAYIDNTQAVLESTRTESGELVGLPIDMDGHDHKGGAGWVTGVELDAGRNVIRFVPSWTEDGSSLIKSNRRRYFSPTVDMSNQSILGGSLTNWPASRDAKGRMMLRPIELSKQIKELADESLDEQSSKVRAAFYSKPVMDYYVREVYDDYLIVDNDGQLYKVNYSTDADGKITFVPSDQWQKVKVAYVEAMMQNAGQFKETLIELANTVLDKFGGRKPEPPPVEKENVMGDQLTVAEFMATPEAKAELEKQAQTRAAELLKAEQLKTKVAEFAKRVTGDGAYGLAIKAEELTTAILALPEAEKVLELVEKIASAKVVNFSERGSNGRTDEVKGEEVPAAIKPYVRQWVEAGKDVTEFFKVNPELGAAEKYNLSEFAKQEEK